MKEFKRGDKVVWAGCEEYGVGTVLGNSYGMHPVPVRFELFEGYDDLEEEYDSHHVQSSELLPVKYLSAGTDPEDATNPDHYRGDLVMQVIESVSLDFALGNTVKYVCRAGKKGDKLTDLKKGMWYLERAIAKEEAAK